jgi:hypothetical protein
MSFLTGQATLQSAINSAYLKLEEAFHTFGGDKLDLEAAANHICNNASIQLKWRWHSNRIEFYSEDV